MQDDEFRAQTTNFLSWLSEVGVKMNPKMDLREMQLNGLRCRGIFAAADFEEDEIVFSIPRMAILNIQTALPNTNGRASQAIANMPSWLGLTTIILSEILRRDSRWAPYFAVLPESLDSLIFWSERELAELQASTVLQKIGKVQAEQLFSQHVAPLGLENFSTDNCHRIASTIMAYAFDIPEKTNTMEPDTRGEESEEGEEELMSDDDEEKTLLSMIPLADMLNADADRNNARLCCDNEDLEMRTIKSVPKGDELLNDYGLLPRSDLLRRYGYVTDNYAFYDVAEISTESILSAFRNSTIQIPNLEQLSYEELEKRIALAEREGVLQDSYDLVHAGPDGPSIPDELLAFIYLLLVDEETVHSISCTQSSLPTRSKLAAGLVGQVLAALLLVREKDYATTLEEDKKLVEAENIPRRARMAIQVRLGEKQVLREAIQEANSFKGTNKRMRIQKESKHGTTNQNGKRRAHEVLNVGKKGRSH